MLRTAPLLDLKRLVVLHCNQPAMASQLLIFGGAFSKQEHLRPMKATRAFLLLSSLQIHGRHVPNSYSATAISMGGCSFNVVAMFAP